MKVKDLQRLLSKLDNDAEVVLLNDDSPYRATNAITNTMIISEPWEEPPIIQNPWEEPPLAPETARDFIDKLVLVYHSRRKEEPKHQKNNGRSFADERNLP